MATTACDYHVSCSQGFWASQESRAGRISTYGKSSKGSNVKGKTQSTYYGKGKSKK